jgi:hypothetical protein
MSNSKSAIQEIKNLMVQFGFLKNEETEIVKEIFLDAKLVDGTAIKVEGDSLVDGAKVVVVTEEGEIPAPDGVHEIEGGTKVETKEGLIVRIEEAIAEEEMKKPEVAMNVYEDGMSKEMVDMLKEFIYKMGDKVKKMEEQMSSLSTDFNSFKKEPAAKKIADGKTEKFNKTDDYLDSKLEAITALRKTNK